MKKRFERKKEQKTPTNPTGNINQEHREYELEKETIKEHQKKK